MIDVVIKYAREYCAYMENYTFTTRANVTAMTAVAATILLGDTTHSAVYLNQKAPLKAEQIGAWAETRLLVIDEISSAINEDFTKLHKPLRKLKQQLSAKYGGLDIVFCGDLQQLEKESSLSTKRAALNSRTG